MLENAETWHQVTDPPNERAGKHSKLLRRSKVGLKRKDAVAYTQLLGNNLKK